MTAFEGYNHLTSFVLIASQVVCITQSSKITSLHLFFWRLSRYLFNKYSSMHHRIRVLINEFISGYPILFFVCIIIILVIIGSILFSCVEHWTLFNSFYFTSVTMATIGYGDIFPITHAGKILAVIYGFMGAPLFVWLTWLFFQNKFQILVKRSIHAYHQEAKEAELLALQNEKTIKEEEKEIKKIEEEEKK